ncbi:MAG: DUF4148 domain-containing protein [Paraburkholderia sp.]|uniref:DUF4148 domain-containing protein n=1 Tax=Paraburkholderia sp. TaxID=1926495 RepID=UPI003C3DC164
MNTRHLLLAVSAAIAFPVAGYAQESGSTVTRAQVRAELVQLESVGYRPGRANNPHYPDDIQAAEAKVAAQTSANSNIDSGIGGVRGGSSASGSFVTARTPVTSLYTHH